MKDDFIVCPRAEGIIKVVGFEGYLFCPDYYLICTGAVICNEMYDCEEKKSEIINGTCDLDYENKTSQNMMNFNKTEISEDNYEFSTKGKCSQYCAQCPLNGQCKHCKPDYGLV